MTLATGEVNSGGFVRDADGRQVVSGSANATPLPVGSKRAKKGYAQATSTAASALLSALVTIPAGSTGAYIRSTAGVRWRDDGTNPSATVGYPLNSGEELEYNGDQLAALRFYGAATLDCDFFA